jgi:hypothetical protein
LEVTGWSFLQGFEGQTMQACGIFSPQLQQDFFLGSTRGLLGAVLPLDEENLTALNDRKP